MKKIKLIALCLALGACGADKGSNNLVPLPSPPPVGVGPADVSLSPVAEVPESTCDYIQELRTSTQASTGKFQFLERLETQNDQPYGVFNFGKLPQARFAVSQEASKTGKSPIVALSAEEFGTAAKETLCAQMVPLCDPNGLNALSSQEIKVLKKVYKDSLKKLKDLEFALKYRGTKIETLLSIIGTDLTQSLLEARNTETSKKIEESFPGAITGQSGPLAAAPFYQLLKLSLGGRGLNAYETVDFTELSDEIPLLFNSWDHRHLDLRISLALMEKGIDTNDAHEKACQFVLAQRVSAQLITLKGIRGTPKLTDTGRIQALPLDFNTPIEYVNVNGIYRAVADANLFGQLLMQDADPNGAPLPRVDGAQNTAGLLDSLRFFTALTSVRSKRVWYATTADLRPGLVQIDQKLLQLGFGFLGVGLKTAQSQEIETPTATSLRFKGQDTAENLSKAGRLAVEFVSGLEGLKDENDMSRSILAPAQLALFLDPYEKGGALAVVSMLETGVALEGMTRIRAGVQSKTLRDTIHVIGEHLGNDYFRNF